MKNLLMRLLAQNSKEERKKPMDDMGAKRDELIEPLIRHSGALVDGAHIE